MAQVSRSVHDVDEGKDQKDTDKTESDGERSIWCLVDRDLGGRQRTFSAAIGPHICFCWRLCRSSCMAIADTKVDESGR